MVSGEYQSRAAMTADPPPFSDAPFYRRLIGAALIVVLLLILWKISLVLILTFGGVLVAVILRSLSAPLQRFLHIPALPALIVAALGLVLIALGIFDLFGILAARQFYALFHRIPDALDAGRQWLSGFVIGRQMLTGAPNIGEAAMKLVDALPLAGGIVGGLGEALLVFAVGIYFAADPKTYIEGTLRLFPPGRRERMRTIMTAIGEALANWFIGMCLDMVMLAVMIFAGMAAIGMPLPFALAMLSGVAVFVPYIGPAIALIPGMLVAFSVSPMMALYAALVYLVALTIEGNISQPMLQRWAVSVPPVINLLAILAFSPLFGFWGAVLATPLSVALTVVVRMAYVEDILKDKHCAENQS
jgi:predicted PurR-regulated permease PerM